MNKEWFNPFIIKTYNSKKCMMKLMKNRITMSNINKKFMFLHLSNKNMIEWLVQYFYHNSLYNKGIKFHKPICHFLLQSNILNEFEQVFFEMSYF